MKEVTEMTRILTKKHAAGAIALSSLLIFAACSGEEDADNLVTRLRILAIEADPPGLNFGQQASLSSLVYESRDGESVEYSWSWCPFPAGRGTGYECSVSEEELSSLLEQYVPGSAELLPPFFLGTGKEAQFEYSIPAEVLQGVCSAVLEVELPEFVQLPSCDKGLEVLVKLSVKQGEQKATAIKKIALLLDDTQPANNNPVLGSIFARPADAESEIAEEILPGEGPVLGGPTFRRGEEYVLEIDVAEIEAESYLSTADDEKSSPDSLRETLFVSWYVTAGQTDVSRTSFVEEKISIADLRTNTFRAPFVTDYAPETAKIFVVLQDNRGGVDWLERTIQFVE